MKISLEEFNSKLINLAEKAGAIRKYSYGRRGLKFDLRCPNKMLSRDEKQRVVAIEKEMQLLIDALCTQK